MIKNQCIGIKMAIFGPSMSFQKIAKKERITIGRISESQQVSRYSALVGARKE